MKTQNNTYMTDAQRAAKELREYIKTLPDMKSCKWSVTVKRFNVLTVALMAGPFDPFKDATKSCNGRGFCDDDLTPDCERVMSKAERFVLKRVRDNSDIMTDYFDRNILDFYEIGKWDKPFQRIN